MSSDVDSGRLGSWCAAHVAGFRGPFTLAKFPGGQSNPTYLMEAASGRYVVRRKPFGELLPSAHAVDREYRLMSALGNAHFPVPRTYALCMDDAVIGSAFFVMAAVAGETHTVGSLPGVPPGTRRDIYVAMTDTLADLHGIDPARNGLEDYGRPGDYFKRQVARWTKQYRASETDRQAEMEQLIDWLPETLPPQQGTTIVHGDYRVDNLIFGDGGEVRAVLDWELSTLGDPLADLSYYALSWVMPPDGRAAIGGLDHRALGIPPLPEMLDGYCRRTGRTALPDLSWYFAFNLFRYAAILQGVKRRALDGNASSANTAELVARIPELARLACSFAGESRAA